MKASKQETRDIDKLYSDVIFDICGIRLRTSDDIDEFYDNLTENLTIKQIEQLQEKMHEVLHGGV